MDAFIITFDPTGIAAFDFFFNIEATLAFYVGTAMAALSLFDHR